MQARCFFNTIKWLAHSWSQQHHDGNAICVASRSLFLPQLYNQNEAHNFQHSLSHVSFAVLLGVQFLHIWPVGSEKHKQQPPTASAVRRPFLVCSPHCTRQQHMLLPGVLVFSMIATVCDGVNWMLWNAQLTKSRLTTSFYHLSVAHVAVRPCKGIWFACHNKSKQVMTLCVSWHPHLFLASMPTNHNQWHWRHVGCDHAPTLSIALCWTFTFVHHNCCRSVALICFWGLITYFAHTIHPLPTENHLSQLGALHWAWQQWCLKCHAVRWTWKGQNQQGMGRFIVEHFIHCVCPMIRCKSLMHLKMPHRVPSRTLCQQRFLAVRTTLEGELDLHQWWDPLTVNSRPVMEPNVIADHSVSEQECQICEDKAVFCLCSPFCLGEATSACCCCCCCRNDWPQLPSRVHWLWHWCCSEDAATCAVLRGSTRKVVAIWLFVSLLVHLCDWLLQLFNACARRTAFSLVWFGLVWFGLVWFGLVWFGLVWFGLVWFGLVLVRFGKSPPVWMGKPPILWGLGGTVLWPGCRHNINQSRSMQHQSMSCWHDGWHFQMQLSFMLSQCMQQENSVQLGFGWQSSGTGMLLQHQARSGCHDLWLVSFLCRFWPYPYHYSSHDLHKSVAPNFNPQIITHPWPSSHNNTLIAS